MSVEKKKSGSNRSKKSGDSGVTLTTESPVEKNTCIAKSETPKKQVGMAKRWCFTLHNYTEKMIEDLNRSNRSNISMFGFMIFSEEKGKEGETPHLQGYFEFKIKKRPIGMKDSPFPKETHFEVAKGNRQQNLDYIKKEDGNIYTNGQLERKVKILQEDKMYVWEKELIEILKKEPDDRAIYWYYDKVGNTGKSTFTKYCCAKMGAITLSNKASDMKYGIIKYHETSGIWPNIIIVDIPRSVDLEFLSYTGIEEVKNGCFFSSKYECQQVIMPAPHIVVFANQPPDTTKMSADRWNVHKITTLDMELDSVVQNRENFVINFNS